MNRSINIYSYLEQRCKEVDKLLVRNLPRYISKKLEQAVSYSISNGGKRLRPIIMAEAFKLFSNEQTSISLEKFMCALEFIHTFSLIHDDLPAIDNDDYRRGRHTVHKVFGEDIAILAGDALFNQAIILAAETLSISNREIEALNILVKCSKDMIDGESKDVEGNCVDVPALKNMYELKTSRLIEASFTIGAVLGGANKQIVEDMRQIGSYLGLSYQLQDDILDIEGNQKILGKPVGSDEINRKITLVKMIGIERAREEIDKCSKKAKDILKEYMPKSYILVELVKYLIYREK